MNETAVPTVRAGSRRINRWRLGIAGVWLVAAVLLFLALRSISLQQIASVLGRLSAAQVLILAGVNVFILMLMTARWSVIIHALGYRVSFRSLIAYRLAGFGVSYLTPGPQFGGEPLQVHLLHLRQGIPLAGAVSSVYFDRLIDLLANFTFLAIGVMTLLFSGVLPIPASGGVWVVVLALLVLPAGHLGALRKGHRPATWLIGHLWRIFKWGPLYRGGEIASQTEQQISSLISTQPRAVAGMVFLSAFTWAVVVFEFGLMLQFFDTAAGMKEIISALTAARLAFLAPVPGGFGVLEAGQALAAQQLGWAPAVGIAVSIVIRTRDLSMALIGLWVGGWNYRARMFSVVPEKERS